MTRIPRMVLVVLFLLPGACRKALSWSDPVAQTELKARGVSDQAIRDTLVEMLQAGGQFDTIFMRRMMTIDSANSHWLEAELLTRGWPRRSVVGDEAAGAAFLIVQHATHDTGFMARSLAMMEPLVADSEVRGQDVAMLADRLAVQRGGKQRYGTQAKIIEGKVVLDPIEDSAGVDARRAALGMPTLARNVAVLESVYTKRPAP